MFIKLTLRLSVGNDWADDYFVEPAHLVAMHRQKDSRTCLIFVDGSEVYVAETPLEIMRLIGKSGVPSHVLTGHIERQQARIAELELFADEIVEAESMWDPQRVAALCGARPGESIRASVEPTLVRLTEKVAELEAQAAIGHRAVEMLRHLEWSQLERQQARIAELEAQAAIGHRAVEMLRHLEWSQQQMHGGVWQSWAACICCGGGRKVGHSGGCVLAAILRDAEQAGMGVES